MNLQHLHLKHLVPDAFSTDDERRKAGVLLTLIVVSWAVYLLVCFLTNSFRDLPTAGVTAAVVILQGVTLRLLLHGHLDGSAFLFLVSVLISVTNLATFGQGIEDVGVIIYPIAFVFAGLTLTRRLFLWYVALTFAATLWLGIGQALGLYLPRPRTSSTWVFTISVVAALAIGALAVHVLSSDLRKNLASARRELAQRKQAEAALRASEAQLRQIQKMEAVGQLAGGIAHDFNNLLHAIRGYSELLLLGPAALDPAVRHDLQQIMKAAERGSSLTKQILAFSRRQALRPAIVILNDVIDKMEPLLRRSIDADIELVTVKDTDLWTVEVDVHQFEQVIMNLALNARDAMPSGGRLTMETANAVLGEAECGGHEGMLPGEHVMLRISDTGVGMDEATRARAFEPFFTTKEVGKGTGLGLAVVYGIVRQSGGGLYVRSRPGEGTVFTIYLPRVIGDTAEETAVENDGAEARGTETVLLVEDEEAVRDLVVRVLTTAGYRVLSAGTVDEARQVALSAGTPLDLLVTDVVLPGGAQGDELARELLRARPELPVVYISGYSRDALISAGRLDKGVNLLEKPFATQALLAKVRSVLDRRCVTA